MIDKIAMGLTFFASDALQGTKELLLIPNGGIFCQVKRNKGSEKTQNEFFTPLVSDHKSDAANTGTYVNGDK